MNSNEHSTAGNRKPSAAFLVVLNALLFLVLLLPGLNPIGWLLAVPATAIFVAGSGIWQLIWALLDRRFQFHYILRCIGFILPVTTLVILPFLGIGPARPINQQYPALSQSGEHQARVVAELGSWVVKILDDDGKTLHKEQTEFVSTFNVYWVWGPNERLWLYNSDDGRVHCWHLKPNGRWRHTLWGNGHTQQTDAEIGIPPKNLYPDYAR